MTYILGSMLAFAFLRLSLFFLDQNFAMYFDDVALTMVLGGTLAVGIISAPWQCWGYFVTSLKGVLFGLQRAERRFIEEALVFVRNPQAYRKDKPKTIADEIYLDGKELLELQFTPEDIQTILGERLHQLVNKRDMVSAFFLNLAKYPPAFGLVGTVLGLVNLMRAITEGLDPAQTGVKMALALVATLYGLLFANFIISPFAEALEKQVDKERFQGEIAMQAVLLCAEGVDLLKSQEMLNSFLPKRKRVNILDDAISEEMSA
ncbi:motility protein A [Pseudobacteriovorax antillogorgiicola]|uniref:Flagellar motor component MotA n=1 Tax=Pseudobacteriovorax antillogorgiicola TaxID=1513793 RepID=A0A1Y6CPN8_9BACT|nr:MotA/TolQ/ExbB proton channel family protein [Pseudobacteriovorax antillogorgiicola]TCS46929.1 flagellar motor component MotA [Pseudobacteriovorax antillogorgiicola]SMF64296.1 Flagellar motor component MotA [Pseudobacteriovorax antillogorgiicola]